MRVAYLHGLLSNNTGPKNEWLRTISTVYDPLIDYKERGIFQKLFDEVEEFKPDLLIGASMGGYFAYHMGKMMGIPMLLFNPGLHSRTMEPDVTGMKDVYNNTRMHIVYGAEDDIINPYETIKMIDDKNENASHLVLPHGHRTPLNVFMKQVKRFI